MNYAQLDHIADAVSPLLAIGVIAGAFYLQRAAAWKYLLRAAIAFLLVQQSAKLFQKFGPLGDNFPSTHFAVALCFATFLALLHRKLLAPSIVIAVSYGALILYQRYHTPLELVGAFYAIPVAWVFATFKRKRAMEVAQN